MLQQKFFYVFAILISLFISIALLEFGVRVLNLVNPKSVWLQITERGYITNQKGGNALHTFDDRRVKYTFSEVRTRGEIHDSAANIFVFGDSFTFGLLLEKEDTFIQHLNNFTDDAFGESKFHFVNAGVGGSGLADWVARIENSKDTLPIDGILFVFNYDDFARALHSNLYVIDDEGDLVSHSKRWKQKELKNWMDRSSLFQKLQENIHVLSGLYTSIYPHLFIDLTTGFDQKKSKVTLPTSQQLASYNDYNIKLANFLISRTVEITDSLDIPFWMTTTGFIDFDFISSNRFYNENVFNNLDSISANLGVPYKDITPKFKENIADRFVDVIIPVDGHPNEIGSNAMAQEIFSFIKPLLSTELE